MLPYSLSLTTLSLSLSFSHSYAPLLSLAHCSLSLSLSPICIDLSTHEPRSTVRNDSSLAEAGGATSQEYTWRKGKSHDQHEHSQSAKIVCLSKRLEGTGIHNCDFMTRPISGNRPGEFTSRITRKSGSATDSMPPTKQKVLARDLQIQVKHVGAPFFRNTKHPVRTVTALRLILSTEESHRPSITHALFRAYWVQNLDISDMQVLEKVADQYGVQLDSINSEESKHQLHENTTRLASMGAFGVPCFIVNGQLYWGQDRLVLVEKAFSISPMPRRVLRQGSGHRPHTLVYYHDFSSPWSFLASLQVATIAKEAGANLVYKPFLLGALFKAIKTPIVPLVTLSGSRASYARKDLEDWSMYHNACLRFPTVFPIRSVMALRVAICDTRVTEAIYRAAWVEDRDISKDTVLHKVLKQAGFDADTLLEKANEQDTKQRLRDLTSEVLNLGACGAPTFLVLDPDGEKVSVIWGQDRLNVVADMLCGWRPNIDEEIEKTNVEVQSVAKL